MSKNPQLISRFEKTICEKLRSKWFGAIYEWFEVIFGQFLIFDQLFLRLKVVDQFVDLNFGVLGIESTWN